jgi:hypothetical protein
MIWSWLSLSASLGHYFGSPLTFIASIVGLALATALVGRSRVVAAVMLVIGFWYGRTLYENWHGHRPMMYASRVVHEGMTEEQVRDALAAFSERPWSVSFFDVFFFRETRPYEYPRWPPGVGPPGVALYIHGGTGAFHDHCAFSAEYEDGVCVRVKVSCPD